MPKKHSPALLVALVGAVAFMTAVFVGVRLLGFGEDLTATVDGVVAMKDGQVTPFGWWSVIWRAGFVGAGAAALTGGVIALARRHQRQRSS